MNSNITAALFDFDGTLARLTIDFAQMRKITLKGLSGLLQIPAEALNRPQMPLMENVYALCAAYPQQAAAINSLTEQIVSEFEVKAAQNSELFPFTLPLLEKLRNAGMRCGIVTRNCRAAVKTVFPEHAAFCHCLFSRGDVPAAELKPHPAHLLRALAAMGAEPQNVIMVGDHPMDITAGKAAGCITGGVLSGNADMAKMRLAAPDYLAEDALRLFEVLAL